MRVSTFARSEFGDFFFYIFPLGRGGDGWQNIYTRDHLGPLEEASRSTLSSLPFPTTVAYVEHSLLLYSRFVVLHCFLL